MPGVSVLLFPLLLLAQTQAHQPAPSPAIPTPGPIDRAFVRLYNLDFPGARTILDEHDRLEPADPLTPAVRAVVDLFTELERLHILETEFFLDDSHMVDGAGGRAPDPATRSRLYANLAEARRRAGVRLASAPNDLDGLFATCLASGVDLDYVALVERRTWRSLRMAGDVAAHARKLLSLKPPFYDAYLTFGSMEYIVGSLPFFVRWFVHYEGVSGNKTLGIEQLELVARQGRYYGPFARVLLTLVALREKRLEEAERRSADLVRDFPENAIFRKELARIQREIQAKRARR